MSSNHLFDGLLNTRSQDSRTLFDVPGGRCWSYAELVALSGQLANLLQASGVEAGDRVAVQVHKSVEAIALYLASVRSGAVFLPLNTAYTRAEVGYFLDDAEPSIFVCDSAREVEFEGIDAQLFSLDGDGSGSLLTAAKSLEPEFENVQRGPEDLAAILYTSGTTGLSKGAMLSHDNLLSNALTLVDYWQFSSDDVLLHALPIFHTHGLFVATNIILAAGGSMIFLARFDVEQMLEQLPRVTSLMGVPTFYTRLLADERFERDLVAHIRLFVSGSAPMLPETHIQFEERTGQRILERYGMTETNMNTSNPLHGQRKPGTVGPPLPGVEVRVCDDDGNVLEMGEIGNLQVRGANVFVGYWKMPDKTAQDFTSDGYFDTGDKGQIDGDGYVSIVGRAKDVVITGGLNVYPKEVELFIDDLPGVKESAVIGVAHADYGEAVVAAVVLVEGGQLSESDIINTAKEQLANFKVPKRVVFIDELPRNSMAKVQKNVLREQFKDTFA